MWGNPTEIERRNRILLTLWAYAYEFDNTSLVSDARFDEVSRSIDKYINTGRHDKWWRRNFHPDTGMWIHDHPDLPLVKETYEKYYRKNK